MYSDRNLSNSTNNDDEMESEDQSTTEEICQTVLTMMMIWDWRIEGLVMHRKESRRW